MFCLQELCFQQGALNNLISLVKGPLEYVSDLELPDEQLVNNNANDGESLLNDLDNLLTSESIIAQDVSECYILRLCI